MEGMISTGEKQWRHKFMTLYMRDRENFEKGRQEGLREGREQGRRAGSSRGNG